MCATILRPQIIFLKRVILRRDAISFLLSKGLIVEDLFDSPRNHWFLCRIGSKAVPLSLKLIPFQE